MISAIEDFVKDEIESFLGHGFRFGKNFRCITVKGPSSDVVWNGFDAEIAEEVLILSIRIRSIGILFSSYHLDSAESVRYELADPNAIPNLLKKVENAIENQYCLVMAAMEEARVTKGEGYDGI